MAAELDAITEFLGCNKQEFVMELLISGLEQAKAAAAQGGLKPMLDAAIDRKVAEEGFSVEPSGMKVIGLFITKGSRCTMKERMNRLKRWVRELLKE